MVSYRLEELCEILDSKRVPLSAMQRAKRQGIYPYYGAQGIIDYLDNYLLDGEYLLVAEDGANLDTRTQPIANIAKGKIWVNNHAHILGYNGKCPLNLLGFILNNLNISAYVTGCAQPKLNQENLRKIEINLPSDILGITSILSSLDRKIELNNKINGQLEEMAQAIFKSWFVDFEPFKDGKFVESELGMIPEGWRVGTLSEIALITKKSVNPSKTPEKLFSHYSLPAYDEYKYPALQTGSEIMSNKFEFTSNTTLISKLNPHIKRVWFVCNTLDNAICSTEFIPIKANSINQTAFVHCLINSESFYGKAISSVNGATNSHQRIQPEEIMKISIPLCAPIIEKFHNSVYPILQKMEHNINESLHLANLRDALLPKLMNGEIEI